MWNRVNRGHTITGFSTVFIVLNKTLGQWAVLLIKSEKYFVLTALTAYWYLLRDSCNISKEICNLSLFHLRSAFLHACLRARVSLLNHGWDRDLCFFSLIGATSLIISRHTELKTTVNSSVSNEGPEASIIEETGLLTYASAKQFAVDSFIGRK